MRAFRPISICCLLFLAEIAFFPFPEKRRRFTNNKKCIFGTVSTTLLGGTYIYIHIYIYICFQTNRRAISLQKYRVADGTAQRETNQLHKQFGSDCFVQVLCASQCNIKISSEESLCATFPPRRCRRRAESCFECTFSKERTH